MKKSLLALSVAAAAASAFAPAQAQNVSLYGVMDAAVTSNKGGSVSNSALVSGGHSTSRLGFRGSEDLGGGMKAIFELEAGMAIDMGIVGGPTGATPNTTVTSTSTAAAAAGTTVTSTGTALSTNQIFTRGAFVGLTGGFGSVKAGKISLAANGFIATHLPGSGNFNAISMRAAIFASGNQFAAWRDNTVEYMTPSLNGLTLAARYTFGNTGAASTASEGITADNKKYGQGQEFDLVYSAGKIRAQLYQSQVNLITSATTQMKANGIGATYDFGFMRAGLSSQRYDPSDAASGDRRKLTAIGFSAPLSAAVSVDGSWGDVKIDGGGTTKYSSLAGHYSLSKRTTAYAYYVKADNNTTASNTINGFAAGNSTIVPAPTAGQDATSFGVGLRHSF